MLFWKYLHTWEWTQAFFIAQRAMHKTRAQLFPTINFTFHVESLVFGPYRLYLAIYFDPYGRWGQTVKKTNGKWLRQPAAWEMCANDFPSHIDHIFYLSLFMGSWNWLEWFPLKGLGIKSVNNFQSFIKSSIWGERSKFCIGVVSKPCKCSGKKCSSLLPNCTIFIKETPLDGYGSVKCHINFIICRFYSLARRKFQLML